MFHPIKTSSQIYLTTEDEQIFRAQHNCRTCPNTACHLRHVEPLNINVINEKGEETTILLTDGTLLSAIQTQLDEVPSPCGGRGTCGKCRIRVIKGQLPITSADQDIFSARELTDGWRLACQAVSSEDLTIRIAWGNEKAITVQTGFFKESESPLTDIYYDQSKPAGRYGFAIDIGTTTLAVQLISLKTGTCIGTDTRLNSQRIHGADVITRIQAFKSGFPISMNPHGEQICLTQKDIRELQLAKAAVRGGIEALLNRYGITAGQIDRVYVAGGFGYQLDYEKAVQIGMFPKEFTGKFQAAGNSSLRGAVELLYSPDRMQEAVRTAAQAEEISLSSDPVFQEAYMDAMFFEE